MSKLILSSLNKNINYLSFDKYVLRTPSLSFNEVNELDIDKIRDLCSTPLISEAIFLASPELHQEMIKYLDKQHETTDEKLVFALLKYLLRMGTRCTPFGLFSGCSVGEIADQTNIVLNKTEDYKRVTRLDMNYLCALSQNLESDKEIRNELQYYPNNSLYQIGNEIRYTEYQYINTNRKHFLMSIDANDFINDIIKKSEGGISIKDLAAFIVDPEISIEDATEFVHELIDNQILISSISPSVTGSDYLEILRNGIKSESITMRFDEIKSKLNKLDNNTDGSNLLLYQEIMDLANSFDVKVTKKFLFQTDLKVTHMENKLDSNVILNVIEGLKAINKLSLKKEYTKLKNFKKKFYERFEDEEVPLTLALDVETGIGYGEEHEDADSYSVSGLIDDIILSGTASQKENSITKITQTKLDKLLLKKLLSNFQNKGSVIELKDEDLTDFKESWDEVPTTFSVIIRVYENNGAQPLFYLPGFGGATASYMLSRFGHIDEDIYNHIEKIINQEEQEDVIFAEIVHLPQARVGNVLSRTNLRNYEIPYLAKSALPTDNQILITDLMISIRNEQIILRSKKNNKQVVPILSNAHNIEADPLPIYAFLAEMQYQNTREVFGFSWGDALSNEYYLPRVMYKNIIFSLATWKSPKSELRKINSNEELMIWLEKRGIPNRVLVSDLDNDLFIDFSNELSCKLFLSIIKNRDYIVLKEYLFNEEKALIKKDGKGIANELILSFHKENL